MDIIFNISDQKKIQKIQLENSSAISARPMSRNRRLGQTGNTIDFYRIPYCYSKYQKCVFRDIEQAETV